MNGKRYKTRLQHRLTVAGRVVTDAPAGVALPDTPAVREHVRLKRLIEVKREKEAAQ